MEREENIISEIKQFIDKNRSMVRNGTLGIMIDYFDTSKLKDIGKQYAKKLHEAVVGEKPEYDTQEYKDWYERTMIFEQVMKGFECYDPMYYLQPPVEYQHKYGPRD